MTHSVGKNKDKRVTWGENKSHVLTQAFISCDCYVQKGKDKRGKTNWAPNYVAPTNRLRDTPSRSKYKVVRIFASQSIIYPRDYFS